MRSIEQIIADNGYDNTPIGDSHNLTGRALPEGVEPNWVPFEREFLVEDDFLFALAPLATYDELGDLILLDEEACE